MVNLEKPKKMTKKNEHSIRYNGKKQVKEKKIF